MPQLPSIHFPAYHFCAIGEQRTVEIADISILLFYGSFLPEAPSYPSSPTGLSTDASVFLVIVVLAVKSGLNGHKMPRTLRTIVQDATVYFLVIFTSHFIFEMSLLFARVSTSTVGKRDDAQTSPANHSALDGRVSARFEHNREQCSPSPLHIDV